MSKKSCSVFYFGSGGVWSGHSFQPTGGCIVAYRCPSLHQALFPLLPLKTLSHFPQRRTGRPAERCCFLSLLLLISLSECLLSLFFFSQANLCHTQSHTHAFLCVRINYTAEAVEQGNTYCIMSPINIMWSERNSSKNASLKGKSLLYINFNVIQKCFHFTSCAVFFYSELQREVK